MPDPDPLNATIAHRQMLHPDLSLLRIKLDAGAVPEFEPGQFIDIGLPPPPEVSAVTPAAPSIAPAGQAPRRVRMIRRSYSIANIETDREAYELLIVKVPTGKLTPRLWELPVGGRLWMDNQARGEFTLDSVPHPVGDVAPDLHLVLIASGTGISPFVSMVRTYYGQQRWRKLSVIHTVRHPADLAFRTELEQIAGMDRTVVYLPSVTREPEGAGWMGLCGRAQAHLADDCFARLAGFALEPARCHVYVCGNPQMIQDVQTLLQGKGFTLQTLRQAGNIHVERYW